MTSAKNKNGKNSISYFIYILLVACFNLPACTEQTNKGSKNLEPAGSNYLDSTSQKKPNHSYQDSLPAQTDYDAVAFISEVDQSKVRGTVKFIQNDKSEVRVLAYIEGLKPNSSHGFHIHEVGNCGNGAMAAGSHFDPGQSHQHGMPNQADVHTGDMGNLTANHLGIALYDNNITHLSLDTTTANSQSILDKAVIVHQGKDQFTQPDGGSGVRIGCGIIKQK